MIKIDEKSHVELPTRKERVTSALAAMFAGFIIIQILGLFIIPGIGFIGLFPLLWFGGSYSMFAFLSVLIGALVAICGVFGWIYGNRFKERMMEYLSWFRI